MTSRTTNMEQTKLKEVGGVFVAKANVNRKETIKILRKNGLRLLTYQEALLKIEFNPELKGLLGGLNVCLDGKDKHETGTYTFGADGNLNPRKGNLGILTPDAEKTVFVYNGTHPLTMHIFSNKNFKIVGRRYDLNGDDDPSETFRAIIGIPRSVMSPKHVNALLRKSKNEVAHAEVWDQKALPKTRELLRVLSDN